MGTTTRLALTAAVLATAAACGGSGSGGSGSSGGQTNAGTPQQPSSLVGTVGKNDAFQISLTDNAGTTISDLVAGTYQLTVHDDSGIHNFHLTGPGVDDMTSIVGTGTKTFTVNVKPGTYTFMCDSHPSSMKGSFKVG